MLQLLAVNQIVLGLTVVGFVFASVMMILIVLVQRPQGGGLSDAFGAGAGGGGTAFGAKTGDALTTGTIGVFVLFIALAISLNFLIRPSGVPTATTVGAAPVQQDASPSDQQEDGVLTPTTTDGTPVGAVDAEGNPIGLQRIESPEAFLEQQNQENNSSPSTDEPDETPEEPQR